MESEVVRTRGSEIDLRAVRDGRGFFQRTIEKDRLVGRVHVDDAVDDRASSERNHLTDLRIERERLVDDLLGPARSVAACVVHGTDRPDRHDSVVANHVLDRLSSRDARRSRTTDRRHDLKRSHIRFRIRTIRTDGDPGAIAESSRQAIDREGLGSSSIAAGVVDCPKHLVAVCRVDVRHVLGHEEIEAQLATERGFSQGRAVVTDTVRLQELGVAQYRSFRLRTENHVAALNIRLVDVHDLTGIENLTLSRRSGQAAQLPAGIRQELVDLAAEDLIQTTSDRQHRRVEVLHDQVLEGLGLIGVLDDERRVQVLIQHDRHIGRSIGLDGHVVRSGFPLGLELSRLTGIDRIPVLGDDILEVAMDEIAHHHVFFENRDGLVSPQLRNEGIRIVIVHDRKDGCLDQAKDRESKHLFHLQGLHNLGFTREPREF